MQKILFTIPLILLLSGCSLFEKRIRTEYVDKPIPVYVVPMPPEIQKPEYQISKLTPEQYSSDGEFVKAVTATFHEMEGYIQILESIYNKYKELAIIGNQKIESQKTYVDRLFGLSEPSPFDWSTDEWQEYYNKTEIAQ